MTLNWIQQLTIRDLRNIQHVTVDLHPSVNVLQGPNAQGKTSLLEAVGLVARGRSFRTEHSANVIRYGSSCVQTAASGPDGQRTEMLALELHAADRLYWVNGRRVPAREYVGRLDVVIYSTDRLSVVYGGMRDRRQFLDRQAAALWPAYRAELRAFERSLVQRNAALQTSARNLDLWTEPFVQTGARLRHRRADYVDRLRASMTRGFRPGGESYDMSVVQPEATEEESARMLAREIQQVAGRERAAGRTLAGPHRDPVALLLDGRDARETASSGQARSLLLAVTLGALEVYRNETGRSAVALLDDLDSELDAERAYSVCTEIVAHGQALVTTAHPAWSSDLQSLGRIYSVSAGEVRPT